MIGQFIVENIELVVFILGGGVSALWITSAKVKKTNNDLTPLYIRYNKQQEAINKRTKSIL